MSKKPAENSSKKNVNVQSAESKSGKNENHPAANEGGNTQPAPTKQGRDRDQNKKSRENKHK
ncbi:hypothetical protein [Acerihabitans arboris]|uniref:Uncharacterized protein n=1 Tax=Acerihabitans arboris TaxID=2691583 RepID=A0A845SAX2_9GAMM|nr:hypothetical protein [Acerihabitans arboris]NDL61963.1 hypothetical protein [Acerihabitans arboris]